ncbi:MAG: PilT/PilU family type 4a pilus ATPase [Pseudomonadota bacterium]
MAETIQTNSPLDRLLSAAFKLSASDIHLKAGGVPRYRIQGVLRAVEFPEVSEEQLEDFCRALTGLSSEDLKNRSQLEFVFQWSDKGRFRGHYYKTLGQTALALRAIPFIIPAMGDLRLPAVLKKLCGEIQGLILVTGATGMGKSTTLAAMLDFIAKNSCRHIISIEDPVEFVVRDGSSCVTQREVGRDIKDFEEGLVAALRQDPDVIMIGEIRDRETMEVAMRAAVSGHLVLGSAHFTDSTSTIEGLVSMAPPDERQNWRFRLAESLKAIISQRLLPKRDANDRVLAAEILVNHAVVKDCIQDPTKTKGIRNAIIRGRPEFGTQTMDQSLLELLEARQITLDIAKGAASSPSELAREVNVRRIETD